MDSSLGNNQTTQGIWLSVNKSLRTIIFDCEGTDSKERGEDRGRFENSSSLFCLAMSDVLFINMWTQDVGRYTASNYHVLKIVFEMNLKLFTQKCEKKIVIILRDFHPKQYNKEKLREQILKDIENIWKDIKTPYDNCLISNYFKFDFITLSHKIYNPDEFEKDVDELRNKLIIGKGNSNFLFEHSTSFEGVPTSGLVEYCSSIWSTIVLEKDLNIPNQKYMLAVLRCNEIKNEIFGLNTNSINTLNTDSLNRLVDNYKERVLKIYDLSIETYHKNAKDYQKEVYEEVYHELDSSLKRIFYQSFTNQINRILPTSLKFFIKDLERENEKKYEQFHNIAISIKKEHLERLKIRILDIRVWEEWEVEISEFDEQFDNLIENEKNRYLKKIVEDNTKSIEIQVQERFIDLINNPNSNSNNIWIEFNGIYSEILYSKLKPLYNIISEFKVDSSNLKELLFNVETTVYNGTFSFINKKCGDLSNIAVEYFKKKFMYDDFGHPRVWKNLQEIQIEDIFKEHRKEGENLIKNLSCIRLINCPIKECKHF